MKFELENAQGKLLTKVEFMDEKIHPKTFKGLAVILAERHGFHESEPYHFNSAIILRDTDKGSLLKTRVGKTLRALSTLFN